MCLIIQNIRYKKRNQQKELREVNNNPIRALLKYMKLINQNQ
jgi:hypothetical protein